MTTTYCGLDCCGACAVKGQCGGCIQTGGRPFGGTCAAAESVKRGGPGALAALKEKLLGVCNSLDIPGLTVSELVPLIGFYVNLEYPLANGQHVKLLADENVYLGAQIQIPERGRCYGVIADERFLLVSEYGPQGAGPEIVLYKRL